MHPISRTLPGAHGLSLHLLEWPGAEPGVLFLHGFGMSARVWEPFAAALAPRRRALALDARGHGDSDHDPEFRYSHAAVTRDVEAAVDALGLERFALVGHSMGGYAAIRYAARHPQRAERLVLVDAGADLALPAQPSRRPQQAPPLPGFQSQEAYATALLELFPRAEPGRLRELARHWLRPRPDGRFEPKLDPAFLRPPTPRDPESRRRFDRRRWAREESARLWRELGRIPCPTLVVRGAESKALSAETQQRMLDEALPDGRGVSLSGAGHAVMLDAPDALRRVLVDFLAS